MTVEDTIVHHLQQTFVNVDVSTVDEHPERTKVTFWSDGVDSRELDGENLTYLSAEDLLREAQKQMDNKYAQVNVTRALELLEDE